MLFALPFAGVGAFMLYLLVAMFVNAVRMSEWPTTPANVLSAELEIRSSDDGTSELATATYRYEWLNTVYEGDRVGLSSMADNIGSYHRDKVDELQSVQRRGATIPVYVNPKNPSDSILFPELRWGMVGFYLIFVLTFGGVGFGLLIGCMIRGKKLRAEERLQAERPDEPWMWDPKQAAGEIPSGSKTGAWVLTGFAVFWNAISTPVLFAFHEEFFVKGNKGMLIALIFPLIGFCMIGGVVYLWIRYFKFGNTRFLMQRVPGVIGGTLTGAIQVPRLLNAPDGVELTLRNVRRVTTGSGKHRSTTERELWTSTQQIHQPRTTPRGETLLPVQFTIPYECESRDKSNSNNEVLWKLIAEAEVPGVDFKAEFDVPVYRTPDSNPDVVVDRSVETLLPDADARERLWDAENIHVQPGAWGTTRVVFPMMRHKGYALSMFFFTVIWNGVAVGLHLFTDAPVFFPLVFGFFGLLMILGTIDMMFKKTVLELSAGLLNARLGVFARKGPISIQGSALDSLKIHHGGSANSTELFSLKVTDEAGKSWTLATQIKGRSNAEAILAYLKQQLGLDPEGGRTEG